MNDILTNQLNMIGACISTAESAEHRPVWDGQPPEDFAGDLIQIKDNHAAAIQVATIAGSVITGAADAKDEAETALENLAHRMARALCGHYKKTGDIISRAKVDIRLGELQKLRDQALVTRSTEIRDLAFAAVGQPGAQTRGITADRIATLSATIGTYDALLNRPRSAIADRTMHLRDLTTRVAGLMEEIRDLDDLVIQFDGTEAGRRFIAAWKQSRIIVDAGHGPAETPAPPMP